MAWCVCRVRGARHPAASMPEAEAWHRLKRSSGSRRGSPCYASLSIACTHIRPSTDCLRLIVGRCPHTGNMHARVAWRCRCVSCDYGMCMHATPPTTLPHSTLTTPSHPPPSPPPTTTNKHLHNIHTTPAGLHLNGTRLDATVSSLGPPPKCLTWIDGEVATGCGDRIDTSRTHEAPQASVYEFILHCEWTVQPMLKLDGQMPWLVTAQHSLVAVISFHRSHWCALCAPDIMHVDLLGSRQSSTRNQLYGRISTCIARHCLYAYTVHKIEAYHYHTAGWAPPPMGPMIPKSDSHHNHIKAPLTRESP